MPVQNQEIDRNRYTEEELVKHATAGRLPGFLSVTRLAPELLDNTIWQPVINTSVLWLDGGTARSDEADVYILTGIRKRQTNPTHPDVVSTPTLRVTRQDALELLDEKLPFLRTYQGISCELQRIDTTHPISLGSFEPNLQPVMSLGILPRLTRDLLAKKLDVYTDPPEKNFIAAMGLVSLSKVVFGFSYVDDNQQGQPRYEPIVMWGDVLSTGMVKPNIPDETNDYRNLTFSPLATFADSVQNRDVARLVVASKWDEVYACVRGLCLNTSGRTISDLEDVWLHMGYPKDGFGLRSYHDPVVQRTSQIP